MIERSQKLKDKIQKLFFLLIYKGSFKTFGVKSTVRFPFRINGASNIEIGEKVFVNDGSWLMTQKINENEPQLIIGDGTYIGRNAHFVSVRMVEIGKNVLIADKVYISDNLHQYRNIDIPIKSQEIIFNNAVKIGDQSWLGENVCVIGATIGKHCIIGANSVVTKNIPDYSIAVGSPAKIIKQYNHQTKTWDAFKY